MLIRKDKNSIKLILLIFIIVFPNLYGNFFIFEDKISEVIRVIDKNNENQQQQPKISYNWNWDFIHITGANWTQTNSTYGWCNGKGTEDNPYVIENVTINKGGSGTCIFISDSHNIYFTIRNCTVYNSGGYLEEGAGIKLKNVHNGTLEKNHISDCYTGIMLKKCLNNTIAKNNIISNIHALSLSNSNETLIYRNIAVESAGGCFSIGNSYNNIILENTITDNDYDGVFLYHGGNHVVERNTINDNGDRAINVEESNDNLIYRNEVNHNGDGVYMLGGFTNSILSNDFISNGNGLILIGDDLAATPIEYNNFSGNLIANNNKGINMMFKTNYNIFTKNTIINSASVGVDLDDYMAPLCNSNDFYANYFNNSKNAEDGGINTNWNNSFIGNFWDNYTGSDIDGDGIGEDIHSFDSVIDYHPIYENPFYKGEVIHIDDAGVSSRDWELTSLMKAWCKGSGTKNNPYLIEELSVNGKNSENCILIGNSSKYFNIENCVVNNSKKDEAFAGIKINNTMHGYLYKISCIGNHSNGILIDNSKDIIIFKNHFENNYGSGIRLSELSSNILIYNSSFISNKFHAIDNGIDNYWNNSVIGNYWDNYTGLDSDGDGIGDIPFNISGTANNKDYLPINITRYVESEQPELQPPQDGDDDDDDDGTTEDRIISFGLIYLLFIAISIFSLIILKARKSKISDNRII